VIDIDTSFLERVLDTLCSLAFNGLESNLEGELPLPEYGLTENVGFIPEIL